jgi:hypothetical protein
MAPWQCRVRYVEQISRRATKRIAHVVRCREDLTAWHALCRAIGVEPLPKTCEQCEEVGDRVTKFGRFMLTPVIGCTKDTCQYR